MATFKDSLDRIRYYLRDLDSVIWKDDRLLRLFNDIQVEVSVKTGLIERAETYRWPPSYTFAFTHDWEQNLAYGDRFQFCRYWSADNRSCCFVWEPAHWLANEPTGDDGDVFTSPLESTFCTPGMVIMAPLHARYNRMIYASFAMEELEVTTERELSMSDPGYQTRSGEPVSIYFPDQYHNHFCLYPNPSNYTWDEPTEEESFGETTDEGIVTWREGALDMRDTGFVLEDISSDNVLMIYEGIPFDVEEDTATWKDDLEWDGWMMKAIEAGVLSRAFGSDNDGYIPSLRDYWDMRYKVCLEALKTYKRMRSSDVEFVLGMSRQETGRSRLRLPHHFPRVD